MLSASADAVTICHPSTVLGSTALGWAVGLLQFLPWFLSPLLFVRGAFAWAWRQELFASLLLLADKVLFVLAVAAQVRLDVPVPDLDCTDVFGTLHGFPCVAALRLGFYLGVALLFHRWRFVRQRQLVPWPVVATMGSALLLIVGGLLGNGLNTPTQVIGSLLIGACVAAPLFMLLVRTLLYRYFVTVVTDSKSALFPLLGSLLGVHDSLLCSALDGDK